MMPVIWLFILIFLANLGQPAAIRAAEVHPEELDYRLSLGSLGEVGQVHLRLTQEGAGRFRAEFAGAAQGVWRLLSRWLPERYETEMIQEKGRLKPLVYREEFMSKGHHVRKEYRFNYAKGLLVLWRSQDDRPAEKRWQVPLKKDVYDPLSLFYNLRLGALGPLVEGETLRASVMPTPEPQEMVIRIGLDAPQGHKVMLEVTGKESAEEAGPYFIFCNPQWVPVKAWFRVPLFGKLQGELISPGAAKNGSLPARSRLANLQGQPKPRNQSLWQ
jgi:Protein of unknown function (DUF3108)